MHQRGLCICPDCVARLGLTEDEQREQARAWIRALETGRPGAVDRVADGVVKRKRAA